MTMRRGYPTRIHWLINQGVVERRIVVGLEIVCAVLLIVILEWLVR